MCIVVVGRLLDQLFFEVSGAKVPPAMRLDTEQMQTAMVKVCDLVMSDDPTMRQDVSTRNPSLNFIVSHTSVVVCSVKT